MCRFAIFVFPIPKSYEKSNLLLFKLQTRSIIFNSHYVRIGKYEFIGNYTHIKVTLAENGYVIHAPKKNGEQS